MTEATVPQRASQKANIFKVIPLASLPVIGMLVFVIGVGNGVRDDELVMLGLAILTALTCFVPLLSDQLRPRDKRHILLSLLCLTYALAFAFTVYTEYFLNDGQMPGLAGWAGIRAPDLIAAQLGALVGLLSMLFGYALPIAPMISSAIPEPRRDWPLMWCFGVALVLIPLGWSLFLAGQFGLIPARAGSGLLGAFAGSFYFGIALLTLCWLRYRSRIALIMMLCAVPPTSGLAFFTGSKQLFLLPMMMVAFAYIVETRKVRPSWIIGGVLLIITIYPIAAFQRQVVLAGDRLSAVDVLKHPGATLGLLSRFVSSADWDEYFVEGVQATGKRFNSLGITSIIMRDTPDRIPFQEGWSIGYVFAAYVPRVFWPGKPNIAIGQWITTNYGPGPHIKSHTAPSWIGEFYMNFGYAGIVIGMLLMGIYIRLIHSFFFRPRTTIPIALAAVSALQVIVLAVEKALSAPINGLWFQSIPIVSAHIVLIMLSGPLPRARPAAPSQTAGGAG